MRGWYIAVASVIVILILVVWIYHHRPRYDNFYEQSVEYPELDAISSIADEIREELIAYEATNPWEDWPERDLVDNNPSNQWKVIPLYAFEKWSEKHCHAFPKTVAALSGLNRLRTAGFSRLGAGTELRRHRGWKHLSNHVLRCHYGLDVPVGCGIWCDGEYRDHAQDKWLVFDDSKPHSAWNNSYRERIVLIVDMERPADVRTGTSRVDASDELNEFVKNM